jgi:hypothetical protein
MKTRILICSSLVALAALACDPDAGSGDNNGQDAATDTLADVEDGGFDADASESCTDPVLLESQDINGGVTLDENCYLAESDLRLDDGQLEILPGVTILFAADVGLEVTGDGVLSAAGEDDKPIVFEGVEDERGFWRGIYFNGSDSPDNLLDHVELANGGSSQWTGGANSRAGLYMSDSANAVSISNSVFRESGQAAIVAVAPDTDLTVADTEFRSNAAPIWLHANLVGGLSSLNFSDNDTSQISTSLEAAGETISDAQTWEAFDVPYRVRNNLFVSADLTLSPGASLVFDEEDGVDIGGSGSLNAVGTQSDPIRFVGAQQERAFWAGLYFHDTSSADNVLEHVEVAHAGGDDWTGGLSNAGVFVREGGVQLTIRNSTFLENGTAALLLRDASADLTIESSTFENNDMPISSVANTVGAIASDNSFSDNDASYVRLNGRGSESRVTTAQTWSALGIPVRVGTDVIVESDLTVAPGATITFEEEIGFLVAGGSLAADGRGADPITFTAAGGSTSNGYWAGIGFTSSESDENVIANAAVEYGGFDEWIVGQNDGPGNIVLDNDSQESAQLALDNVDIVGSGGPGIQVGEGSALTTCTDLSFSGNAGADITGAGTYSCN